MCDERVRKSFTLEGAVGYKDSVVGEGKITEF